jgi:hypothetical protein
MRGISQRFFSNLSQSARSESGIRTEFAQDFAFPGAEGGIHPIFGSQRYIKFPP